MGEPEPSGIPRQFALTPPYPNPFNARTTIRVALPEQGRLRVDVFNLLGQRVVQLAEEVHAAGYATLSFDATDLPSGVYITRASLPGHADRLAKLVLVN